MRALLLFVLSCTWVASVSLSPLGDTLTRLQAATPLPTASLTARAHAAHPALWAAVQDGDCTSLGGPTCLSGRDSLHHHASRAHRSSPDFSLHTPAYLRSPGPPEGPASFLYLTQVTSFGPLLATGGHWLVLFHAGDACASTGCAAAAAAALASAAALAASYRPPSPLDALILNTPPPRLLAVSCAPGASTLPLCERWGIASHDTPELRLFVGSSRVSISYDNDETKEEEESSSDEDAAAAVAEWSAAGVTRFYVRAVSNPATRAILEAAHGMFGAAEDDEEEAMSFVAESGDEAQAKDATDEAEEEAEEEGAEARRDSSSSDDEDGDGDGGDEDGDASDENAGGDDGARAAAAGGASTPTTAALRDALATALRALLASHAGGAAAAGGGGGGEAAGEGAREAARAAIRALADAVAAGEARRVAAAGGGGGAGGMAGGADAAAAVAATAAAHAEGAQPVDSAAQPAGASAAAAAAAAAPAPAAAPLSTSATVHPPEPPRSLPSRTPRVVAFVNARPAAISVFWVDFGGVQRRYAKVDPGRAATLSSFTSHVWVVKDAATDSELVLFTVRGQQPGEQAVLSLLVM